MLTTNYSFNNLHLGVVAIEEGAYDRTIYIMVRMIPNGPV